MFSFLLIAVFCLEVLAVEPNIAQGISPQDINQPNGLNTLPVEVYYHLRYAKADRFADPVLADYEEPLADGKGARIMCPQRPWGIPNFFAERESLNQSEDCHFLTIYTPSRQGKYPVMVWIHGGSYVAGSGEDTIFDASNLAREGQIVVVTINYRLGLFGYLNNIEGGEYNMGLKDQIAALRWVNKHISRFGGDPQRITVVGESAGAHAVATLVANTNEPLFQKVIIQSAPYKEEARDSDVPKIWKFVCDKLGKDPKEATMEELLDAQNDYVTQFPSPMPFGPYQSQYYEKPPNPSLRKALITWTRDDCSLFAANLFNRVDKYGNIFDRVLTYITTSWVFKRPAKQFARHLSDFGVECETFQVDWRPEGSPFGAAHSIDVSLLFGSWERWENTTVMGNATKEQWEREGFSLRAKWIEFINAD